MHTAECKEYGYNYMVAKNMAIATWFYMYIYQESRKMKFMGGTTQN